MLLEKMRVDLGEVVNYTLQSENGLIDMNAKIGKPVKLIF